MSNGTVEYSEDEICGCLDDPNVSTVVLVGEPGIGKTWMARKVSLQAVKKKQFDISLWIYLSVNQNESALCENIARQLSLFSPSREWKADDDEEDKDENAEEQNLDIKEKIKERLSGKKLLLILDDEGSKMKEEEIKSQVQFLQSILTKFTFLMTSVNEDGRHKNTQNKKVIDMKPLNPKNALALLLKKAGPKFRDIPGGEEHAKKFIDKKGSFTPAQIHMIGKLLSYHKYGPGIQGVERALCEANDTDVRHLLQLLFSADEIVPGGILVDFSWEGSHFFRNRSTHFSELITYWIMEGYISHTNGIQKAYEDGHRILMELMEWQMLKKVDAHYVAIKQVTFNPDDRYRKGFGGIANLGLADIFADGDDWGGFGKVTQKDGTIKTFTSNSKEQKQSVLLLDGNCFSERDQDTDNLLKCCDDLKILGLFNPRIRSLSLSSSAAGTLNVLVLRGCDFLEDVQCIRELKSLTVLEVSGAMSLTYINDDIFAKLHQLRSLNLSSLQIKALPRTAYDLTDLRWLILRECSELKELQSLRKCKRLVVIDLSGATSFESFKERNLKELSELQILNLSNTNIRSLPVIQENGKLSYLSLSGCQKIDRMPKLQKLTNLEVLDISGSSICEFNDPSFKPNARLKVLDLSRTAIPHLPDIGNPCFAYLKGCEDLEEIRGTAGNLEVLDLSGCTSLNHIEDKFFENLAHLRVLKLSETKIPALPSLSRLSNLHELLLSQCKELSYLPSLNSLSRLEVLDLSGCEGFKKMEDSSLSHLKTLRHLNLRNCVQLATVPDLETLTKLEYLDISGTALKHQPNIGNTSRLHYFRGISVVPQNGKVPLPDRTEIEKADSKAEQYQWVISSLPPAGNELSKSLNCSEFSKILKENPLVWETSYRDFQVSVYPTQTKDEPVCCFQKDESIFPDIYHSSRHFSHLKDKGRSLRIHQLCKRPDGIEDMVRFADYIFLFNTTFMKSLADLGAANLKMMKGCWVEGCQNMEYVICEDNAESINEQDKTLEILWISSALQLKSIYSDELKSDIFRNLKCLYLDSCPKLTIIFSSSHWPHNLEVLHVKFCDKMEMLFKSEAKNQKSLSLRTLLLWELPELTSIGCRNLIVHNFIKEGCPKLKDDLSA